MSDFFASSTLRILIWICLLFTVGNLTAQRDSITISEIILEGNRKTKRQTILREMNLKKGDLIAVSDLSAILETNRLQLLNTGLFILVKINIKEWNDNFGQIKVAINFQENWFFYPAPIFELADRNFNIWWVEQNRSLRRVDYGMRFYHINLTGRRDRLKTTVQFGFTRKYEISYTLPTLGNNPDLGIIGEAFYAENKDIGYKTVGNRLLFQRFEEQVLLRRFRTGGGLSYRKGIFQYHTAKISYHHNTINDYVIQQLNDKYFLDGKTRQRLFYFSYNYTFDNRDFKPYPRKGQLLSLSFEKEGFGIFNERNGMYLTTTYAKYIPITKKISLEAIGKTRVAFLRGTQPYNNYWAMGYEEDFLRGYEFYVIDGLDYFYLKSSLRFQIFNKEINWGNLMLIPQFRVMPFQVYLSINNDVGIANDTQFTNLNPLGNRWLWGGGPGLDFVFYNDKIIQFQYSTNHLGENALFLHYQFNF